MLSQCVQLMATTVKRVNKKHVLVVMTTCHGLKQCSTAASAMFLEHRYQVNSAPNRWRAIETSWSIVIYDNGTLLSTASNCMTIFERRQYNQSTSVRTFVSNVVTDYFTGSSYVPRKRQFPAKFYKAFSFVPYS
jgi:hypothetical protein